MLEHRRQGMGGDRSVWGPSDADISFCVHDYPALFSPYAHHPFVSWPARLLAVGRPGLVVCRVASESVGEDENGNRAVVEEDLRRQELRNLRDDCLWLNVDSSVFMDFASHSALQLYPSEIGPTFRQLNSIGTNTSYQLTLLSFRPCSSP